MIVKKRERKYKPKIIIDDSKIKLKDNWRIANCEAVWNENENDSNSVTSKR